jgi:hypothetical protein
MATEEEQAHEAAHAAGVPNDQPAPHGPTADAIQKVNDLHADELANLVVQRFDAHVGWWRTIVKYISAFLGHQLQVWTQVALMLLSFKLGTLTTNEKLSDETHARCRLLVPY